MAVTSQAITGRGTAFSSEHVWMGRSPEPQREPEWLALNGRGTGHALCDEQINPNRKRPPV